MNEFFTRVLSDSLVSSHHAWFLSHATEDDCLVAARPCSASDVLRDVLMVLSVFSSQLVLTPVLQKLPQRFADLLIHLERLS
jgi:hypothetical protein